MISKFTGGVLLIVGTSIGGGMLALPVATASTGPVYACLYLLSCWLVMTLGALLVLEVNLSLPPGTNMVSMAKKTLGFPGQILAWVTYLFLLYTLLAAYISGSSDVISGILRSNHLPTQHDVMACLFTGLFGFVVYNGMRSVDYLNRILMFGKLGILILLILIISPHVHFPNLLYGTWKNGSGSIMILITSFGFASIVPSLRDYFRHEPMVLRKLIIIGSLIPLFCYMIWITVIAGVIPQHGEYGLLTLRHNQHAASGLSVALNLAVHHPWITHSFNLFSTICMLTAFLGVSIGLFDFIADGLNLRKQGFQGLLTFSLTFLPPLLIEIMYPGIYLQALQFAGFCCVMLLLFLPVLMTWRSRRIAETQPDQHRLYDQHASIATDSFDFKVPGGNFTLLILGLIAVFLFFLGTCTK